MYITLIGAGNIATVIGRLLTKAGHTVMGVYSKTVEHAQHLAVEIHAQHYGDISKFKASAELYIIAVSDDIIETVANSINVQNQVVVHTSGAVSINALRQASGNYGVLYPLQSLRKESTHQPAIPFLIDGNSNNVKHVIKQLAKSISPLVQEAGDEERLKLHMCAVMVSNFTNHLYALAEEYCLNENVPFKTLAPLIQEIANRSVQYSPKAMQTGPGIRNDQKTIEKHIQLLDGYSLQQGAYQFLTKSINAFYKNKP